MLEIHRFRVHFRPAEGELPWRDIEVHSATAAELLAVSERRVKGSPAEVVSVQKLGG